MTLNLLWNYRESAIIVCTLQKRMQNMGAGLCPSECMLEWKTSLLICFDCQGAGLITYTGKCQQPGDLPWPRLPSSMAAILPSGTLISCSIFNQPSKAHIIMIPSQLHPIRASFIHFKSITPQNTTNKSPAASYQESVVQMIQFRASISKESHIGR